MIGASSSFYVGFSGVLYLIGVFRLEDWTSDIAFFFYLYMIVGCYAAATGYIGVFASYHFVSRLYKDSKRLE